MKRTERLIQRVQNACCRFCFSIPPRSHITPYLNKSCMLNMVSRRELHLACLVFEVIKFGRPVYLRNKLKVSPLHDRYGSRSCRAPLAGHLHRTVSFRGSFRFQATKCWNDIPPPIRNLTSKNTFKNHLKIHLLEVQRLGIPKAYLG